MPSAVQETLLSAIEGLMRPIASLLLHSGIGFREFSDVAKACFVQTAAREFGLRGRQTNTSRIAAMTGLTRKEVRALRAARSDRYLDEASAQRRFNTTAEILHFWHSDPEFLDQDGFPRPLHASVQEPTFLSLCRKYGGDIPVGAVRAELRRAGAIREDPQGFIHVTKRHFTPMHLDEAFVRSMGFSLQNLAKTLAHNASLYSLPAGARDETQGRLERYVWSVDLSSEDRDAFKRLIEAKTAELLADLDEWLAHHERAAATREKSQSEKCIGLGVYFFADDD